MRILMWFAIGFAAACAAAAYALEAKAMLLLCVACAALCAAFVILRKGKVCRFVAVVLAGMALGFGWYSGYDALYLRTARSYDGQIVPLTVEASDYSYENSYGTVVDGTVRLDGKRFHVRVYTGSDAELIPGRSLSGEFRLRYTAAGGQEDPTYHRGEGTFLLAYATSDVQIHARKGFRLSHIPAYFRQNILKTIRAVFPEDASAFACALLLGDTTDIDHETDTAFKLSGIRHVIAVSGLHVSILFSLIYILTGRRRLLNVLLGIPVLLLFAAMAGFSPSINRACLMQLILLLSTLVPREYDPPTSLSFAVLVMLLINPQTVTSVGFQLSVASVAGIFLFYDRICEWMRGRIGKRKGVRARMVAVWTSSVSVSLSAMVFTTPLTAAYFGTVSLVGVVTNLLTLWVISVTFCGIILACLVGMIFLPAGTVIAWMIAWPIRFVTGMAKLLSSLPFSAVYTESVYIVAWLVLCYVLLAMFLLMKRKRPFVLACCIFLALCASLTASWLEPRQGSWRMTVLDVGQGQCILLQSGGRTYMVDCGGSDDEAAADLAAATLLSQGIRHLDGLILTHYDRDHVGGVSYLLSRICADKIYLPYLEDTKNDVPELSNLEGERVRENIQLLWRGASLTIFAPIEGKTDNETSLCVLFQGENCDILITGDRKMTGEVELLLNEPLPDLEILVAGHHGADTSTSEFLLRATQPETVVISVDKDNRYGHPSETLLRRLQEHGCLVRRTDLEGTVILKG